MLPPEAEGENARPDLLKPCGRCGRTFHPDALAEGRKTTPQKPEEQQREVLSEEKTTKRSRGGGGGTGATGNKRQKEVPSGYVQCPGCDRCFNQRAAERHIPWCQQRKQLSGGMDSPPLGIEEKKKKGQLMARVTYRPAPPHTGQPPRCPGMHTRRKEEEGNREKKSQGKAAALRGTMATPRSSPPSLSSSGRGAPEHPDRHNTRNSRRRRSGSRSSEKESTTSYTPECNLNGMKFKERFPHRIRRGGDLEESLTSEQLRDLLRCSRSTERCPRTVPGVRLSGATATHRWTVDDCWTEGRGSSNKAIAGSKATLPEVSSSELSSGTTWNMHGKRKCWNLDQRHSTGGSSSGRYSSLPPLSRERNDEAAAAATDGVPSLQCHQCSSQFSMVAAKYCCECGAKRTGLSPVCINQSQE